MIALLGVMLVAALVVCGLCALSGGGGPAGWTEFSAAVCSAHMTERRTKV